HSLYLDVSHRLPILVDYPSDHHRVRGQSKDNVLQALLRLECKRGTRAHLTARAIFHAYEPCSIHREAVLSRLDILHGENAGAVGRRAVSGREIAAISRREISSA